MYLWPCQIQKSQEGERVCRNAFYCNTSVEQVLAVLGFKINHSRLFSVDILCKS